MIAKALRTSFGALVNQPTSEVRSVAIAIAGARFDSASIIVAGRIPAVSGERLMTSIGRIRTSISRSLPAVAERLRDMDPSDLIGAGKVGDGACDAQHAMEAAR